MLSYIFYLFFLALWISRRRCLKIFSNIFICVNLCLPIPKGYHPYHYGSWFQAIVFYPTWKSFDKYVVNFFDLMVFWDLGRYIFQVFFFINANYKFTSKIWHSILPRRITVCSKIFVLSYRCLLMMYISLLMEQLYRKVQRTSLGSFYEKVAFSIPKVPSNVFYFIPTLINAWIEKCC